MITVFVRDLSFEAIIGIFDFERDNPQKIVVDASFVADEFVDYAEVCKEIISLFKSERFYKVEDALEFFANFYKEKFQNLRKFTMSVTKTEIIENTRVGASIEINY
ncbi:MAG: dihydroneopterin aldolase [Campylobacter sp.]|nr:dihydroneopterin aldolase [Campylobacter sp.]